MQGPKLRVKICSLLKRYELFPNYNGLFRQANTGNSSVIFDVRWKYPFTNCNYDLYHGQYNIQALQELMMHIR